MIFYSFISIRPTQSLLGVSTKEKSGCSANYFNKIKMKIIYLIIRLHQIEIKEGDGIPKFTVTGSLES